MTNGLDLIKDQDFQEVLVECYRNMELFCKVFLADDFTLPFSNEHRRIFQHFDEFVKGNKKKRRELRKKVFAAPRSFGKSTLITKAFLMREILYCNTRFIVPVSNTADQAMLMAENLKRELISNDVVGELFGDVSSDSFSKERWVAKLTGDDIGTMVMPRGSGQQIRGVRYLQYRPHRIVCDDFEDSESVKSEEQRAKRKKWFLEDLCNSVNVYGDEDWMIIVVGTILHEDSLLQNLLDDPEWNGEIISICDDNYESNWPEAISTERIKELVEEFRSAGELDSFYREFMNKPVASEDATFKQEYFKYYDPAEIDLNRDRNVESVVLVDPAKTVKLHSADSAIVGVGIDVVNNIIYVRDIIAGKMYPDQLYNEIFAMAQRLGARTIGVEVTSLNEFITHPLRQTMLKAGHQLELIELKARGKKEQRVASLVPFYRQGLVRHNKACCGVLEAQLMSFPRSKRWDVMDALAYAVEMFEVGGRYFSMREERPEDIEREYAELDMEEEPPIPPELWQRV